MRTTIDLKLNLKNFYGELDNGKKYKIAIKTKFVETVNAYMLEVVVKDSSKYFSVWMHNLKLSTSNWYKKGEYKQCLRDSLLEVEDKLGVQLLKSTMKIAV